MNKNYQAIISLIKSALTGQPAVVSDDLDWNAIFGICQSHHVTTMVFYGIENSNLQFPERKLFATSTMQNVLVEQQQLNMLDEIGKRFSGEAIDYLPLKGTVLKKFYPKSEMRVMGDMDILIREEQLEQIDVILEQLGCQKGKTSDHVVVYEKKPCINLEMHIRLVPSYDRDYYRYFKDGWKNASPLEHDPCRYIMAPENMFLFEVAHLAKHYREGGIGLRHFVDLWVLLSKHPQLDMEQVKTGLRCLQMERFYQNIIALLDHWFYDAPPSEMTEYLTKRIFESGSYGTREKHQTAVAARISETRGGARKGRLIELVFAVFMPFSEMKKRYKALHKVPVLLPVFWVVRWLTAVFKQPKNIKKRLKRLRQINESDLNAYTSELDYVGLGFHLTENGEK